MIEVEYYFSTSNQWIMDFAKSFSESTGLEVVCKENKIIFPESMASGRYEYYKLSESLGMLCVDAIFLDEILLQKTKLVGNDYYGVVFNIGEDDISVVQKLNKRVIDINSPVKQVVLSSHTFNSSVLFPKNKPIRYVQIFVHRSWAVKNLTESRPTEFTNFDDFANAMPMGAIAGFDLKSYKLANEILELDSDKPNLIQILEGYACQLIALFFNNLEVEYLEKKKGISQDIVRIIDLKEKQELNLAEIVSLAQAAEACFMSKTKFASMFNTLFKKNYGEYFIQKKMEKAEQLLKQGLSINSVRTMLGYSNMSYFAKTFKKFYGVAPKTFIRNKS
ncbi:helix-turn-helix domain-containing protein [Flavobacterium phragmitis]|uniref:AraC-type DNA-binding protein n=1 Tax=Flavobacterium phragmitis TaxID=739143 RepID=A0A1I1RYW5_9FLAO|nr:AraC family transcriptional regulator [Flavobacterium phragmitis]SFD39514.1 AraC-type DNA-binding protein [Flavobacterium phragmitis]